MGLVDSPSGVRESTCLGDSNTKRVRDSAITPCAACGASLPGAWVHTLHYRPSVFVIMVLGCGALWTYMQSLTCSAIWSLVAKSRRSRPRCPRLLCHPVGLPTFQGTHPCFTFLPSWQGLSCSHPRQVFLAIHVPVHGHDSDASCTGLFPGLSTYRCLSGQILVLECLLSMQSLYCMRVAPPLPAGHALSLHLNTFTSPSHQSIFGICWSNTITTSTTNL